MILILNGTSSAGKSSIARALQVLADRPLLHLQMDSFLAMMPPRYANHEDAFLFQPTPGASPPSIEIRTGPYGKAVMAAMRRTAAVMVAEGLDVVVDDVMLGEGEVNDYRQTLMGTDHRFIGVFCDLAMAEKREAARGDRMLGLARWQYPRVHTGLTYDLTVDTTQHTPQQCAQAIVDAFCL